MLGRIAAVIFAGLLSLGAVAQTAAGDTAPASAEWLQKLFPGSRFEKIEFETDNVFQQAVIERADLAPPPGTLEAYLARDASGRLLGAAMKYRHGYFVMAVGLNINSRIEKALLLETMPEAGPAIAKLAPKGVITRFTAMSVRQVRSTAQSLRGGETDDAASMLADEVLRVAGTLDVLLDRLRNAPLSVDRQ